MNEDLYFKYGWRYKKEDLKFCPKCGGKFSLQDIHIVNEPQLICHSCQFIFYLDPKLVVTVCVLNKEKNKVLLLKRAEEPMKGLWAFSGGYVERGSDIYETAKREVFQETMLRVEITKLLKINTSENDEVIELVFEAISESEIVKTNIESFEGKFFSFNEIPVGKLAFETTKEMIDLYKREDQR